MVNKLEKLLEGRVAGLVDEGGVPHLWVHLVLRNQVRVDLVKCCQVGVVFSVLLGTPVGVKDVLTQFVIGGGLALATRTTVQGVVLLGLLLMRS